LPWVPARQGVTALRRRPCDQQKEGHRLWREEGLQVKVISPRKRAGVSSIPPIEADAPNVVWAIDFQFDSTVEWCCKALGERRDGPIGHALSTAQFLGVAWRVRTA
jgi:hypothetical protein